MTTTTIPLNKLFAWDGNVRKTESDKAIDELAASIASHGLLQSLVVRKEKTRQIRRDRRTTPVSCAHIPGREW